jgi:hypothetical protein
MKKPYTLQNKSVKSVDGNGGPNIQKLPNDAQTVITLDGISALLAKRSSRKDLNWQRPMKK